MSQAPDYTPSSDFSDYQTANPAAPFSGVLLDSELDAISTTTLALGDNAERIQRDDGLLRNQSVHLDSLSDAVKLLIGSLGWTPRGSWLTATSYAAKDLVTANGVPYVAVTGHVSGTFAADLASGLWLSMSSGASAVTTFSTKTSGFNLVSADRSSLFLCTGQFTITATAAATLGAGWSCQIRNEGVNDHIVIDPSGAELVDDRATISLYPGDQCTLICTGTEFITQGLTRPRKTFTSHSSGTLAIPEARYAETYLCDGGTALTLPVAATVGYGWYVDIVNIHTTTACDVDGNASETINGQLSLRLFCGDSVRVTCTGTAWIAMFLSKTIPPLVIGNRSSWVTTTTFQCIADAITLKSGDGGGAANSFYYGNPADIINTITTAGPAANGRDQAAAFTVGTWVHFYFIYGPGLGLATISSPNPPPVGPTNTMPAGYLQWCYVGCAFFNASSLLDEVYMRGDIGYVQPAAEVLTNGAATSETEITLTNFVPPNALDYTLENTVATIVADGSGIVNANVEIRHAAGKFQSYMVNALVSGLALSSSFRVSPANPVTMPAYATKRCFYIWNISNGSSPQLTCRVTRWRLPILAA